MRRKFITLMNSSAAPVYTISGAVYDADGSTAVAGATVALGALTATSAANGTYTIANVPAGTSGSMTCTKTGYSWSVISVSAMVGNLTNQNYSNAWWATSGIAAGCVGAYRAIGAASLAASYSNLANPGMFDLTVGNAPAFDASYGWSFTAGSKHYLRTGIQVPASSNYSMILRCSNYVTGNFFAGVVNGTNNNRLFVYTVTNNVGYGYGGFSGAGTATFNGSGVIAVTPTKGYYNAVEDRNTGLAQGTPTQDVHIGRMNDGTDANYCTARIQAVAVYSINIASNIVALTTSIQGLT